MALILWRSVARFVAVFTENAAFPHTPVFNCPWLTAAVQVLAGGRGRTGPGRLQAQRKSRRLSLGVRGQSPSLLAPPSAAILADGGAGERRRRVSG